MTARVRDFLYLDPVLVAQTLSQLDFGVFKEWEETLARASGKEGSGALTLWGAANLRGGVNRSHTEGTSVVFEQTAESYASRLLIRLEEEEQLIELESDPPPDLRRGTVLIAEGSITEFSLERLEVAGWSHQAMIKLYELAEQASELEVPGGVLGSTNVKAIGVVDVGSFTLISPWIHEYLRVPVHDVLGEEAEMLAVARRTYGENDGRSRTLVIVRPIAIY